jgi:hypothetical protein
MTEYLNQTNINKEVAKLERQKKLYEILVECCIESADKPPITLIETDGKKFELRSQLNLITLSNFGSGKSTIMKSIPHSISLTKYTLSGMLGSITKNGDFMIGKAILGANKTIILDEANFVNSEAINSLKTLLEDGYYDRTLGYPIKTKLKNIRKKDYRIEFDNREKQNSFKVIMNTSCMSFAEYRSNKKMDDAFFSRFFPIRYRCSREDNYALLKGKTPFKFDFKQTQPVKVIIEDYLDIVDAIKKEIDKMPIEILDFLEEKGGYEVRTVLNVMKIYASILRQLGITHSNADVWQHLPLPLYAKMGVLNSIKTNLTHKEMDILEYFMQKPNSTRAEACVELNITPPNMSAYVGKLKMLKLLE